MATSGGAAGPNGVLLIHKPTGVTSRKVVDVVAKAIGTKAVGHAGTLDPLATGIVIVCVGYATRLVDFLHGLPKTYAATFLLGQSSPSDDLETEVSREADPLRPRHEEIEMAAAFFRGEILQRPCDYSAVHIGGKRAYRLARKGRELALAPKRVRIDRLAITAYDWPRLGLDIDCSSGTFIRAVGRDLAAALGTTAVMESLARTAVGPFSQEEALSMAAITPETVRSALLPPTAAVGHLPAVTLADDLLERAIHGAIIDIGMSDCVVAAIDGAGDLVGILARHDSGRHRLRPNFCGRG
jgi:tRNA pseudouridine55 synthase